VGLENIRILREEKIVETVKTQTAPYFQQRLHEEEKKTEKDIQKMEERESLKGKVHGRERKFQVMGGEKAKGEKGEGGREIEENRK